MTRSEAVEFTGQLQSLVSTGMPLPAGLLALSAELPSGSHKKVLEDLAESLRRGESLEAALDAEGPRFPPQLRGLIVAGVRSGRLGEALARFLEMDDLSETLRRRLRSGLMYPAIMLLVSFSLFVFVSMVTTDGFAAIFLDFGIPLPWITHVLIVASKGFAAVGWWLLFGPIFGVIVIWVAMRLTLSKVERDRLIQNLPLVGPLARDTALAQFCPILAMLLESEIPLPEALRLAAGSSRDSAMGAVAKDLALSVENGWSLSEAVRGVKPFPAGFDAFLRWAEEHRGLVAGLQLSAETFQIRARSRAVFVSRFCNVVTMTIILWWVGLTVLALLTPLVALLYAIGGVGFVPGDQGEIMKMVGVGMIAALGVTCVGFAVWPLIAKRGRVVSSLNEPRSAASQQNRFWYLAALGWSLVGLMIVLLLSGRILIWAAADWLPEWWMTETWPQVQILAIMIAAIGFGLVAFATVVARLRRRHEATSKASSVSGRVKFTPTWRFGLRHMMFGMAPLALLMVLVKEFGVSLFAFLGLMIPPFVMVGIYLALADRKSIQREALLQVMALAARDSQPLGPAVAAFAPMCRGGHGRDVGELAHLLERGDTLPQALTRLPKVLNRSSTTIARVGWSTGTLGRVLDDAVEITAMERSARAATYGTIVYPMAVLVFIVFLGGLLTLFIAPKIAMIFKDMQVNLPEPSRSIFAASLGTSDGSNVASLTPPGLANAAFVGVLFVFSLVVFFFVRRGWDFMPFMDRFSTRRHAAIILKSSAAAVENGQPITTVIDTLAESYPRPWIRERLVHVAVLVRRGTPWIEALRKRGLISRSDAAVLDAAERVGNLPWALRETAQSSQRRQLYRLMILGQLFQTMTVIGLGAIVFLFAVTYFRPLVTLIESLSRNAQ